MYLPKSFAPPNAGALRQFMHAHQNRSERDRAGVVDGLMSEGSGGASAMAALVRGTMARE